MRFLLIIILLILSLQSSLAQFSIFITNIKENKGHILAAIYNSENTFLNESAYYKILTIEIKAKHASYSLDTLPAGYYAISLFQDINKNKKLDTNLIGVPIEPYGFSNNAMGTFGPPSYQKAKFYYNGKKLDISIILKKLI